MVLGGRMTNSPDSHVGNLALGVKRASAIAECHHISENVAELLNTGDGALEIVAVLSRP